MSPVYDTWGGARSGDSPSGVTLCSVMISLSQRLGLGLIRIRIRIAIVDEKYHEKFLKGFDGIDVEALPESMGESCFG